MDKKHNVAGVLTGKKSALKLIQKVAGLQVVPFFTRDVMPRFDDRYVISS